VLCCAVLCLESSAVPQRRAPPADAGDALAAVTNARLRGEPPLPAALLSLAALALRAPAQHASGRFWGVAHARGSQQLSEAARLAVFGAALQLTIDDLLTGTAQVRRARAHRSGRFRAAWAHSVLTADDVA
jgi:hypothetical protein